MKATEMNINELNEAVYNPRKRLEPNDHEYKSLKNSIQKFGYVTPIIVNKRNNVVVSGHQRMYVMQDLGYTTVQCVFVDLNDEEEKTLNIAMNKISGEWDNDKLAEVIQELTDDDIDMSYFGFEMYEIDELIGNEDIENDIDNDMNDNDHDDIGGDDDGTIIHCPRCQHVAEKGDFRQ